MNKLIILLSIYMAVFLCDSALVYAQLPSVSTAVSAITGLATTGFGGPIEKWEVCDCSGSVMITLFDFRTLKNIQVIYIPFLSRLNKHFNFIVPGNVLLGTYFGAPDITSLHQKTVLGGQEGPLTQAQSKTNPALCIQKFPVCSPAGNPVGVITPFPFSGVGTTLTPPLSRPAI